MTSPYLTRAEAAAYLRYATVRQFMRVVTRLRTPHIIRGRERLFIQCDLDDMWTKPAGRREDSIGRQRHASTASA